MKTQQLLGLAASVLRVKRFNMLEQLKDKKYCIIGVVVALLVGRFALQPKGKTETRVVEKVIERVVTVEKTNKKADTKIIEKKNVDGSIETVTVIHEDTTTQKDSQTDTKTEKSSTHSASSRGVAVGLIALEQIGNFKSTPEFGVTVSAPVFGSVSVTGLATLDKRVGLGISVEF
jgi:hypothetical protein